MLSPSLVPRQEQEGDGGWKAPCISIVIWPKRRRTFYKVLFSQSFSQEMKQERKQRDLNGGNFLFSTSIKKARQSFDWMLYGF